MSIPIKYVEPKLQSCQWEWYHIELAYEQPGEIIWPVYRIIENLNNTFKTCWSDTKKGLSQIATVTYV